MCEFTQTTQRVSPGSPLTWRWPENTGQEGDSDSLDTHQYYRNVTSHVTFSRRTDEISQITADEENVMQQGNTHQESGLFELLF